MIFSARPYQSRARTNTYAEISAGSMRTVLVLPPGSGKTFVAYLMIEDALSRARPTWFFAHRRGLVTDPAAKFEAYSNGMLRPHVVMAGHSYDAGGALKVASIQTLLAREIKIEPNAVCFVDEVHLAMADDVIAANPGVLWIGLTGTPIRDNGRPLRGVWQSMVIGPRPSELLNLGVLARKRMVVPVIPAGQTVKDFLDSGAQVSGAVEQWQRHASGLRTLAFCSTVQHAKDHAAECRAAGIGASVLSAQSRDDERSSVLEALETGAIDVVCNVGLFKEGTDLPWLECTHDLSRSRGLAGYIQKNARADRVHASCRDKVQIDQVGNFYLHGLSNQDREWSLSDDSKNGKTVAAPSLFRCAGCGYLKGAPGPCARCGFLPAGAEREVLTVDGEMAELTAARAAEIAARRKIEASDKDARRVFQGIAFGQHSAGRMRLGEVSGTAAAWFDEWKSSGKTVREFTRAKGM